MTTSETTNVSRRAFFGLSAAAALTASMGGLTGCAPQAAPTQSAATASSLADTGEETNPQDDSYFGGNTDVSSLFEPWSFGALTVPNRLVKSAAGSYSIDAGIDNDQAANFYVGLAKGGVGLIWCEDLQWYPYTPDQVKVLTDKVHEQGGLIGLQAYGSWNFAASSRHLQSPLEMDMDEFRHTKMSIDEIHALQDTIVAQAAFARQAGFDAFEINCSCDHAFDTFLSRFWNNDRDDEYGPQSFENRARIVTEIIERVKKEQGANFPISVLFNGIEENVRDLGDRTGCIDPDEAVELAKLFEKAGADALQVRSATFGNHCAGFMPDIMHVCEHGNTGLGTAADYKRHLGGIVEGSHDGSAALETVAALVKSAVSIPVGFVGSIDPRLAPEACNGYLSQNKVDFLVLNRALLADPELPVKLQEGRIEEVRPCNRCVNCFKAVADMYGIGYCRVNASYIRGGSEEMPEGAAPAKAETPQKILVAGGGPAGMEAAIVCAQRGHEVSLFEAKETLGGRLSFAAAIKGPHERLEDYRTYLQTTLDRLGVAVSTGVTVDSALVQAEAPDAVIVATGGTKHTSTITGAESEGVLDLDDLAMAAEELGQRIAIVGGNIIACDFAVNLTAAGKQVTLVSERPLEEIGIEQASWPHVVTMSWLKSKGTVIEAGTTIDALTGTSVSFTANNGLARTIECDNVFLLEDLDASSDLLESLNGVEAVAVGDCAQPCNILAAVSTANLAARSL